MNVTELVCWITAHSKMKCAPLDEAPPWVRDSFSTNGGSYHNGVTRPSEGLPQWPSNPWLPEPVDKPWYQDVLDTAHGWLDNRIVTGAIVVLVLAAIGLVIYLLQKFVVFLQERDLADDAQDVEWYIEDLNAAADEGMYDEDDVVYDDEEAYA